ncbi:MAG: hypothetical protein S4CHLAM102_00180 [Chlamydiia bacterium]|nr:hypothetical protein [Chlamydiia bacterium]
MNEGLSHFRDGAIASHSDDGIDAGINGIVGELGGIASFLGEDNFEVKFFAIEMTLDGINGGGRFGPACFWVDDE